ERHGAVADLVEVTVDGDERNTEVIGVGTLQLGNIVGESSRTVSPEFLVAIAQEAPERWLGGISSRSGRAGCAGQTAGLGVHNISPRFAQNRSNPRAMYIGEDRGTVTRDARFRNRVAMPAVRSLLFVQHDCHQLGASPASAVTIACSAVDP